MSAARIFLWEAGPHCGTAATRDRAQALAAEFLGGDLVALVEEARLAMTEAGSGGLVPGHERTGAAWRGRLLGGEPVWQADTAGGPCG